MTDLINRQKDIIKAITNELNQIGIFLFAKDGKDICCENIEERCLLDTIRQNGNDLDSIYNLVLVIKEGITNNN